MTNSDRIKDALRLLCWRNKRDSQSAFARKVGLNQSYISGIISGKKTKRLPLETMEKLFPDLVVLPLGMDHGRPPVEKEIIALMEKLSDVDKAKALAMLSAHFPYAIKTKMRSESSCLADHEEPAVE